MPATGKKHARIRHKHMNSRAVGILVQVAKRRIVVGSFDYLTRPVDHAVNQYPRRQNP